MSQLALDILDLRVELVVASPSGAVQIIVGWQNGDPVKRCKIRE